MRAYVGWLGTSMSVLLVAVLCLSVGVDAYGLFGTRLVPERLFPSTQRFMSPGGDRTIKAIEIGTTNRRQDIVFFGSSRVALPFDPASPALRDLNSYNAGLIAGRLLENIAVAEYALQHWPGIRRVIWAVDFDSLFDPRDHFGDFEDSAFAGQPLWKGLAWSLFSWGSVARSLTTLGQALGGTVKADMETNGRYHYFDGYRSPVRPSRRQLFMKYDREIYDSVANVDLYRARIDDRFARLKVALAAFKAHGIDVDLVALPTHVRMLEVFRLSGNWPAFEDWKRRIAKTVDDVDAGPGTGHVRGFDFARVDPVTSEEVPPPGAAQDTEYFYETSHFRPIVADAVVARILGREGPIPDSADFGMRIEDAVSAPNLADQRAKLEAWRASHTDDTVAMAGWVTKPD